MVYTCHEDGIPSSQTYRNFVHAYYIYSYRNALALKYVG